MRGCWLECQVCFRGPEPQPPLRCGRSPVTRISAQMNANFGDSSYVLLLKREMGFVPEKFEQGWHRRPFHIPCALHIDKVALSQMQYKEGNLEGGLLKSQFAWKDVSMRFEDGAPVR